MQAHNFGVFMEKFISQTAKATETTANQIKLFPYKLFGVPPPPNTSTTHHHHARNKFLIRRTKQPKLDVGARYAFIVEYIK